MKKGWGRCLCIGLAVMLAVSPVLAGELETGAVDSSQQEADAAYRPVEETQEQTYTRWHMEYVDGTQYQVLMARKYGMAKEIADAYTETAANVMTGAWDFLDTGIELAGSGEVDSNVTYLLHLKNEYDIVVAYLMRETAANGIYGSSYREAYGDAYIELLSKLKTILNSSGTLTGMLTGKDAKKVMELTEYIDAVTADLRRLGIGRKYGISASKLVSYDALVEVMDQKVLVTMFDDDMEGVVDADMLKTLFGTSEGVEVQEVSAKLFSGARKEIGDEMDELFEEHKEFTGAVQKGFSNMAAIMDHIGTAFSETMEKYCLYKAGVAASEEWSRAWAEIAACAERSSGTEGKKLASSIRAILQKIQEASEDMDQTLMEDSLAAAAGGTADFLVEKGVEKLNEYLDESFPIYKAIRTGLVTGITQANFIANMDDFAYFSQMMAKTGFTSECVYSALLEAEQELRGEPNYQSALYFDQMFHIFKQVQLAACDYAIGYEQVSTTAPLSQAFKHLGDASAADIVALQGIKADISRYECHQEGYYEYIRNNLLPDLGFVSQETTTQNVSSDGGSVWDTSAFWDRRKGLISADIVDLNQDGTEDMVLAYAGPPLVIGKDGKSEVESSGSSAEESNHLRLALYSRSAGGQIYLVGEHDIAQYNDVSYQYAAGGVIELNGVPYYYVEQAENAYFANGYELACSFYEFGADGCFLPKWTICKSDGGSTEIAYSLFTRTEGDQYDKFVLWADGGFRMYNPDEEVYAPEGSPEKDALQYAFSSLGMPVTSQTLPGEPEYIDWMVSYWDSEPLVKKSFLWLCSGTRGEDWSGRAMTVSLSEYTDLKEIIESIG